MGVGGYSKHTSYYTLQIRKLKRKHKSKEKKTASHTSEQATVVVGVYVLVVVLVVAVWRLFWRCGFAINNTASQCAMFVGRDWIHFHTHNQTHPPSRPAFVQLCVLCARFREIRSVVVDGNSTEKRALAPSAYSVRYVGRPLSVGSVFAAVAIRLRFHQLAFLQETLTHWPTVSDNHRAVRIHFKHAHVYKYTHTHTHKQIHIDTSFVCANSTYTRNLLSPIVSSSDIRFVFFPNFPCLRSAV